MVGATTGAATGLWVVLSPGLTARHGTIWMRYSCVVPTKREVWFAVLLVIVAWLVILGFGGPYYAFHQLIHEPGLTN